jgi:hypothetical protein
MLKKFLATTLIPLLVGCGSWHYVNSDMRRKVLNTYTETKEKGIKKEQKTEVKFFIVPKENKFEISGYVEQYAIKNKVVVETKYANTEIEKYDVYMYKPVSIWVCAIPTIALIVGGFSTMIGGIAADDKETGITIGAPLLSASLLSLFIPGFCAMKRPKTEYRNKSYEYVKEKVEESTRLEPIEQSKKALSKNPIEAIVRISAESIGLDKNVELKNGIGYAETDEITSYSSFVKRKEIADFSAICNLQEVYKNLPEKNIEFNILYDGKSYGARARVKSNEMKDIESALMKAGCF